MKKRVHKRKVNPYKLGATIVLIIVVILFFYSLANYSILENKVSDSVRDYGIIPILVFAFLLDFFPQYISPHILVVTANFLDMNMFYAILFMVVGSVLGSIAGFEIGNKLKKSKLLIDFMGEKKAKKIERGINKRGRYIISLAAVSPFPYIPLIIGMLHMKRKNFILYGVVPRVVGLIIIGLLTYGIFV